MGCGSCSKGTAPLRVLKYNAGSPRPTRPKNIPVPVKRKLLATSAAPRPAFSADNRT